MKRRCLALLALMGCAAGDANQPGTDAGAVGPSCQLNLIQPSSAEVGQDIELSLIVDETSTSGAHSYSWSVELAGVAVPVATVSSLGDRVSFIPSEAGSYGVVVDGNIGTTRCTSAIGNLNVAAVGAIKQKFRLRVVPPTQAAPTQDIVIEIFGGASATLPTMAVDEGELVDILVLDAAGAGEPGYLRARLRGGTDPIDYEGFTGPEGRLSLRLPQARFDLLFVPTNPASPPEQFLDVSAPDLATMILASPQPLRGFVFDSDGVGLAGLRVSLRVDGVDTTTTTTGADGAFAVMGRYGSLSGLRVAGDAGRGLPSLRADGLTGQAITGASSLAIRYSQPTISASASLSLPQGGPAIGARAEWRLETSAAATITAGTAEDVSGSLRVFATANGAGLALAEIPNLPTDFVAHSLDGDSARVARALPWPSSANQSIALAEHIVLTVSTTDENGAVVAGTQVSAAPLRELLPAGEPVAAITDNDGKASLTLVDGASYEVSVRATAGLAAEPAILSQVTTGTVGPIIKLHQTLALSGRLSGSSLAIAGASISLHCFDCTGAESSRTLSSSTTDPAGRFVLQVLDPGVQAP